MTNFVTILAKSYADTSVDFDFCNLSIFNRCENTNDVLLAIPGWANVHPLLKVIPVEWEYSIPYGILHSMTPSKMLTGF